MDGKTLVTRIALLIIGFSLLNVILWGVFVGSRGIFGSVIGLVFNVVLAIFLIAGQNWARWLMAVRCGFGAVFSLPAWAQLGQAGFGFFSIIRLWLIVTVVLSVAVGAFLIFSKRVNDHFNPASGF